MQKTSGLRMLLALCLAALLFAAAFFLGRASISRTLTVETQRPAAAQPEKTADDGRLNLNTATREELLTLPQVGGTLADRILDYRAQYGKFVTVEQLADVEGIGEGLMQQLRGLVYVEDGYENSGR